MTKLKIEGVKVDPVIDEYITKIMEYKGDLVYDVLYRLIETEADEELSKDYDRFLRDNGYLEKDETIGLFDFCGGE